MDFNPNKPQMLATCGDDRKVKVWDLRAPGRALVVLEGHAHAAWSVRYNPFHDQLLLRYSCRMSYHAW